MDHQNVPLGRREGLLVIERSGEFPPGAFRSGVMPSWASGMTPEEVIQRYTGIDGFPWPEEDGTLNALWGDGGKLFGGLIPIRYLAEVEAYYHRIARETDADLLYCQVPARALPTALNGLKFAFAGYDYGYYRGAYSNFSSIINDLIYGQYESLHAFVAQLNYNVLMPTAAAVQPLAAERERLVEAGAHLEQNAVFVPIAVYVWHNDRENR